MAYGGGTLGADAGAPQPPAPGVDMAGRSLHFELPEPGDAGRAPRTRRLPPGGRSLGPTLYYTLVTVLLVVLIGGMAVGLAVGCRLPEVDRD